MTSFDHPELDEWEARGAYHELLGHRIFVVDVPAVTDELEPLLVVHGFPTQLVRLRPPARRAARGGGGSCWSTCSATACPPSPTCTTRWRCRPTWSSPSPPSSGSTGLALLTHDMGDTVGGELLARQRSRATWPVEVTRRVVTNGSIYIDMAQLTDGQQLLLSLPDERLDGGGPDRAALAAALVATLARRPRAPTWRAHAELVATTAGRPCSPAPSATSRSAGPTRPVHRRHRDPPVAARTWCGARSTRSRSRPWPSSSSTAGRTRP